MTEIEININKHAQHNLTDSEIVIWFETFDLSKQKQICAKLSMFIQQAHPTDDLISKAIQTAPIKETMTPVVIFKTRPLNIALRNIAILPEAEIRKSFVIMLHIFKIADIYKRDTSCKNGCFHEWHHLD